MPLKLGGGNHMQLYDSQNGEYTDQEKERMRSNDNFALWSYKWNGENNKFKFHFPVEGVHEKEYCKDFVRCIREDIREPIYNQSKMNYLLTFRQNDDKSLFLKSLGYSMHTFYMLFRDICVGTKRDTIEFAKFSHGEMILEAKTVLKGRLVKTIWRLEKDLRVSFVTLIPGGDKLWKK